MYWRRNQAVISFAGRIAAPKRGARLALGGGGWGRISEVKKNFMYEQENTVVTSTHKCLLTAPAAAMRPATLAAATAAALARTAR